MSQFLTQTDQWFDDYDSASPRQQYAMVKAAIAQPIPAELAEDVDLGMLLVEILDSLVNHNQVEETLTFIETLRQQQPDVYRQEFQYYDSFVAQYHLFYEDDKAVEAALTRFKANPVQGIEQLTALLNDLTFYGSEPVLDLCAQVYEPWASSSQLIDDSEADFGAVLISHQLEQVYRRVVLGKTVDWGAVCRDLRQHDFRQDPEMKALLTQGLTGPVPPHTRATAVICARIALRCCFGFPSALAGSDRGICPSLSVRPSGIP